MKKIILSLLLLLFINAATVAGSLPAASGHSTEVTLQGRVTDAIDSTALIGVQIVLPDFNISTITDMNGNYKIEHLPARRAIVQANFIGHHQQSREIDLAATHTLNFVLHEKSAQLNEVVVTGLTGQALLKKSSSPVSVVDPFTLRATTATNIIDAIAHQPGVSQITTGSSISKPVIRGLGYNRIVVVNNGVRQEGQQWGDEHGIEVDAQTVNSVEILKGPASLMYGSDAMAGVMIFNSAPVLSDGHMQSNIMSEYQTNNGLFNFSVNFAGNQRGFVWNWRYSEKMAHDYKNKWDGYVYNSSFRERAAEGMFGLNKSWGYSRLYLDYYHLTPGIVEGERDETGAFIKPINNNGTADEAVVTDDDFKSYKHSLPYQQIHHYKAVLNNSFYVGNGVLKAILGYQANHRQEFEEVTTPGECSLDFLLHTVNYDLRYTLDDVSNWKIVAGANGMYQRSLNQGNEYLIPAYNLFDIGIFATASRDFGRWHTSGGLRFDNRHLNSLELMEEGVERFTAFKRNFRGVTGSVGAIYNITDNFNLRLNASRGFRAPNISELSSNGVHEGTVRYERGNQDLKPEYSWQFDLGLDYSSRIISAQASLFANLIDNYIYAHRVDGEKIDGVDVYQFDAGDARLLGGEISVDVHPVERLHFSNSLSTVNGIQRNQPEESKHLPFIPATRWISQLRYDIVRDGKFLNNTYAMLEVDCNFKQNNFYAAQGTETATPAYTLLNAAIGTDINWRGNRIASIFIIGNNLTNKAYQNHMSRLKYAGENQNTGRMGVFNMGRNMGFKILIPINF